MEENEVMENEVPVVDVPVVDVPKMPGESTAPRKKNGTRRSRKERLEYAAGMKRGKCLELLRPITQCTPADLGFADEDMPLTEHELGKLTVADLCERLSIEPKDLMFKLVSHAEGMRDISDVKCVMEEGDIINGVIPARLDKMVERVPTKVCVFK